MRSEFEIECGNVRKTLAIVQGGEWNWNRVSWRRKNLSLLYTRNSLI